MANATEVAAESTATNTTTSSSGTSTPPSNSKGTASSTVNPNRRRIIKAAPPKVVAVTDDDAVASYISPKNNGTNNTKNTHNNSNNKKHIIKDRIAGVDDDPKTTKAFDNDPQEMLEEWREERFKATEKRGKALREREVAVRRKMPVNETANAAPNPFSRFLSVFSVEPKFPEHKRSYEKAGSTTSSNGGDEDEVVKGPDEKRLKPSESCDPDYYGKGTETNKHSKNSGNTSSGSSSGGAGTGLLSSKLFWVTTAVAVVAGVALALQRGRKK